jgi:hypothetical protein
MLVMSTHRSLLIVLACALGVGVSACGSSGSSTGTSASPKTSITSITSSSPPASPSASASASGSAAQQISANWVKFFDAKTPVPTRISLLQDGQQFASVIQSQAGGGLAAEATAKVTKVTVTSATQATVIYSILVAGQTALKGKSGVAVKQDGTWKVGLASFCGLLILENNGKTTGLPVSCKTVA